jgi:4-aminobutyrate aminotransferase-like enzyme
VQEHVQRGLKRRRYRLCLPPFPALVLPFCPLGLNDFSAGEMATATTHNLTNAAVFERRESHVRSPCQSVDAILDTAFGSIMRDVDGRGHIDFLSSAGLLNYGHNDPNLRSALTEYLMRDGMTHGCAGTEQQRTALRSRLL